MPDAKTIGRRLVTLRGNMPRSDVAKSVNITYSALTNYENGVRVPRDEVKIALAQFYGKTVGEIFFA